MQQCVLVNESRGSFGSKLYHLTYALEAEERSASQCQTQQEIAGKHGIVLLQRLRAAVLHQPAENAA